MQNTWSLAFSELFEKYKNIILTGKSPNLESVLLIHANVIHFSHGMVLNLLEKFLCNFCGIP